MPGPGRGQPYRALLSYCTFSTSLGTCGLAFSDQGLVATVLPSQTDRATVRALVGLARSRKLFAGDAEEAVSLPGWVGGACRAFEQLLAGAQVNLAEIPLDFRRLTPFRVRVYEIARQIPRGARATYGQLAASAGSPGAARAVGQAMASNPWPVVVPCHRVVSSAGALHGFSAPGGVRTKAALLAIESAGAEPDARAAPLDRQPSLPFDC